jgi:glycosyltransferase involved in cell wall biosynthesis
MQSIDSSIVNEESDNVFEAISKESQNYDVFINANQLEKVKPLSPISIFFCHFPNAFRGRYFAVDDYTFIVTNSRFTTKWLQKRWELEPTFLLYPPVEMQGEKTEKENIILSVAQFEAGGTKKQLEMIEVFRNLKNQYPEIMQNWKLILAGGTLPNNSYLKNVQNQLKQDESIEVKLNCSREELKTLYSKASIFWHLCGLEEINPQRCEHFGMATVEAMQNYCVPVVANAGGHQETIQDKISGFLINNLDELCSYTHQLISNPQVLQNLQTAAFQRSQNFTKTQFKQKVNQFFDIIQQEYTTPQLPNPSQVSQYLNS